MWRVWVFCDLNVRCLEFLLKERARSGLHVRTDSYHLLHVKDKSHGREKKWSCSR